MNYTNEMILKFKAISQNESFARVAISGFISNLDPLISEITDVKTAVSEAVTNAIIHGYENNGGWVSLEAKIKGRTLYIEIIDMGKGISNVEEAITPLYTSKPELERSGMGFTVMETFMDTVNVISNTNEGTRVIMTKTLT